MVIRSRENVVAAWAFLLGIIIAVLVGFLAGFVQGFGINPFILGILAIIGIILGYFVAEKDVQTFLLASVSIVIASYMGVSGLALGAAISGVNIGKIVSSIFQTLLVLFAPATVVVALKTVFSISKS